MPELAHVKPLNRWDYDYIQPGPVSSVGDVHTQPRLKHSNPDMPLRFEKEFEGSLTNIAGSNVCDGQHTSFDSGYGPARLKAANWSMSRHFKTKYGYRYQDIRQPDKFVESQQLALGDFTYRNNVATVYEARRTGDMFLPLPGPYRPSPGEVPRGPVPVVTNMVNPVGDPLDAAGSVIDNVVVSPSLNMNTNQMNSTNPRNAGISRGGQQMYQAHDEMWLERIRRRFR